MFLQQLIRSSESLRMLVLIDNAPVFPSYHLTFLFLTSSPCRWLIWRKEPLELMVLTGLTARTGLLHGLERPLTSPAVSFPKRAPLLMLLLLTDKDLYRLSSSEDFPAVCRSVWDLTRRDISRPDQRRSVKAASPCLRWCDQSFLICAQCVRRGKWMKFSVSVGHQQSCFIIYYVIW